MVRVRDLRDVYTDVMRSLRLEKEADTQKFEGKAGPYDTHEEAGRVEEPVELGMPRSINPQLCSSLVVFPSFSVYTLFPIGKQ